MRYYIVISCLVLGTSVGILEASGDDCAGIKEGDSRAYCRAVVTRNPAWCGAIKDGDLRARCRAELKASKK